MPVRLSVRPSLEIIYIPLNNSCYSEDNNIISDIKAIYM